MGKETVRAYQGVSDVIKRKLYRTHDYGEQVNTQKIFPSIMGMGEAFDQTRTETEAPPACQAGKKLREPCRCKQKSIRCGQEPSAPWQGISGRSRKGLWGVGWLGGFLRCDVLSQRVLFCFGLAHNRLLCGRVMYGLLSHCGYPPLG